MVRTQGEAMIQPLRTTLTAAAFPGAFCASSAVVSRSGFSTN
jgi:hypothetical protein